MYTRLVTGLFLLSAFSSAFAISWPLEIIEHLDEAKIIIYAKEAEIEQSPTWDPATGAPSFGLPEVLKSIAQWDNKKAGISDTSVEKIELKPILHQEKANRWYYLVQLRNPAGSKHKHHYLAVLMNGKTYGAIEEPESYK